MLKREKKESPHKRKLRIHLSFITIAAILAVLIGTIAFHYIEDFSWLDSFYFTGMTLTTVGYGDLVPITPFGKIFSVIYIFLGLGIVLAFVQYLVKRVSLR